MESKPLILQKLETSYRIMNSVFLIFGGILLIYVIVLKLKFRMDTAAYVILLTQFAVMVVRVFLKEDNV